MPLVLGTLDPKSSDHYNKIGTNIMSVRFIIGMQEWFFNLSCEKVAASFSNELVKRLAPLRSFYRYGWGMDWMIPSPF